MGVPVLDWKRGGVMALASYLAMIAGLSTLVQNGEKEKYIWDDVEVLR